MIALAASVYSAFRGYSWSRIPEGLSEKLLDQLRQLAAARRGDFPSPESVERGIVAIGPVAAAFSIRSVPEWDSNGRASEYSAFTFFKSIDATQLDFGQLLELPFFSFPTRVVPDSVEYRGTSAALAPLTAAGQLVCRQHLDSIPASQGGDLLAKYFTKSNQWIFRLNDDGTLSVDCAPWKGNRS